MRNSKSLIAVLCVVCVVFVASCAKAPQVEMDAAQAAFSKAEGDANAQAYAPDSVAKAKDLISRMNAAATAKSFEEAKTLAAEASAASDKAIRDGESGRARAASDVTEQLSAAKAALRTAQDAATAARVLAGTQLDIVAIDKSIVDAQNGIQSADTDFAAGNLRSALSKAQSARSALASVQQTIAAGVQLATRKK